MRNAQWARLLALGAPVCAAWLGVRARCRIRVRNAQWAPLLALGALVCAAWPGYAQSGETVPLVRGEILSDAANLPPGYRVEFYGLSAHKMVAEADVDSGGRFEVRQLPYGDYWVHVADPKGQEICQEMFSAGAQTRPLSIRIAKVPQPARPIAGLVSAAELRHPPAKKALQAAAEAQRLSEAHEYARAASMLEKAVAISPDFAMAHAFLAVQQIHMGRFEEAAAETSRAIEIGGATAQWLGNLAYAQYQLREFGQAKHSAEEALRLDPNYAAGHYLLGAALATDRRTWRDAIPHLERAAESLPAAQDLLNRLRQGESAPVNGTRQ